MQFRQLTPDFAFAFGQAKSLATLGAQRNFQSHIPFESWHYQLAPQNGAPRLDLHLMNQVTAFDRKIRMSRQTHTKKKITAFSAARARFTLAPQTDTLPFVNTARNLYLVIFHFV